MNDVVEKYKKQELFKNIGFGILAFVVGFGVSQFMNGNSNTNFLKADLNNSLQIASSSVSQKLAQKQEKKDISLERIDKNNLVLVLNKKIKNAKKLNLNLVYEAKKVEIEDVKSLNKDFDVVVIDTKKGLKILSVVPKKENIGFEGKILNIKIKKLFSSGEDFAFINISSANYESNSTENNQENFNSITSSGINVF